MKAQADCEISAVMLPRFWNIVVVCCLLKRIERLMVGSMPASREDWGIGGVRGSGSSSARSARRSLIELPTVWLWSVGSTESLVANHKCITRSPGKCLRASALQAIIEVKNPYPSFSRHAVQVILNPVTGQYRP